MDCSSPSWSLKGDKSSDKNPQYASDNEEDDKHIENANTGIIQDMYKFAAALTSEEANPIHGGRDDENVGNSYILEEEMDDIDRETACVMKERVTSSTRDGYERRNINFMI